MDPQAIPLRGLHLPDAVGWWPLAPGWWLLGALLAVGCGMLVRSWIRRRRPAVDCRELGKVLQSYLDDDVDPDFATKIAEHLEACKDCGLEAETYTQIKESLAGRRPRVDDDVVDRLRDFGESLTGD